MANPSPFLKFVAVTQVSGIAEARYDVFVLVEARVDRCAPDGGVFREGLADVVDAVGRCDDTYHVHLLRLALGEQGLVTHLH